MQTTLQANKNCTICNKPLEVALLKDIKENSNLYDIYFCEQCKIGMTIPMPTQEMLSELYSYGSYRSDKGKRFNMVIEFLIYISRFQRKKRIKKYINNGHILDIGAGRGLFLDIMRKDGWSATGVEFDRKAALYIYELYKIDVISGPPEEWRFARDSFDAITINHVLEHLHDPAQMISICNKLLRRGGLLVCSVPNILSLQAYAGKGVWFHLDLPYHIHHFTEDGLISLLKKNSFSVKRIRRFDVEYNPYGWLQTLFNITGIRKNFLYSLLKNSALRKIEIINASWKDLLLTIVLLLVYLPLSFTLSIVESFIPGKSGTVEIYAIKE